MKLFVQIPCFNEEQTLPLVLSSIPNEIDGFDKVEILVVDDGSTDKTSEVAETLGVDHVVRNNVNRGLAYTFQTGINKCLELGADIIVNIDGDNQYPAAMIPDLVKPIVKNQADIVIADRKPHKFNDFSRSKRMMQYVGSKVVSWLSKTSIPDAPSGFRAFSRESAMHIFIFTKYTYTIETILQAAKKNFRMMFVPVEVNAQTRPSRLMRNTPSYVFNVGLSLIRLFLLYNSARTLLILSTPFILTGIILWGRFFTLLFLGLVERASNVQSLIFATLSTLTGGFLIVTGIISFLISTNRQVLEETLFLMKKEALDKLRE